MKSLIIFTISIVVIAIGFVGYTLYDTKRFSDDIGEVPTPESTLNKDTDKEATHTSDKPNAQSTNTAQSSDAASAKKDAMAKAHDLMHKSNQLHTHENLPENVDASTHEHKPNEPLYPPTTLADYGLKPNDGERYIHPMFQNRSDPFQAYEKQRAALLKRLGNTPTVNRYLEVSRKVMTADSYTVKELYDYLFLKNEFYNVVGDQSFLPSLKQRAEENPNTVIPSLQGILKNRKVSILPPGTKSITDISK